MCVTLSRGCAKWTLMVITIRIISTRSTVYKIQMLLTHSFTYSTRLLQYQRSSRLKCDFEKCTRLRDPDT